MERVGSRYLRFGRDRWASGYWLSRVRWYSRRPSTLGLAVAKPPIFVSEETGTGAEPFGTKFVVHEVDVSSYVFSVSLNLSTFRIETGLPMGCGEYANYGKKNIV